MFEGAELGGDIIKAWLDRKHRDVTASQRKTVNDAITKCNLPLYVKLVSGICSYIVRMLHLQHSSPQNQNMKLLCKPQTLTNMI